MGTSKASRHVWVMAFAAFLAQCHDHPDIGANVASLGRSSLAFVTPETLDSGNRPVDIVAADFDGDGRLDLATASYGSDAVSVMLNRGGGSYAPARFYDAGHAPLSIATADFDGDGKPDLAVANAGGVSVLRGNGDGSFQPPVTLAASGTPYAVVAGDLDGDGKPDLALANESASVLVYYNHGDGTFAPARAYDGAPRAVMLAAADFDGDGRLDLLVANRGNGYAVLLGQADGTLRRAVLPSERPSNATLTAMGVGDFDGDGKLDVACGLKEQQREWLGALLGKGDGTFREGPSLELGYPQRVVSLIAADLDGDGKLDLAAGIERGTAVVALLGQGDGSFRHGEASGVWGSPRGLAAADLDGDGKLDLAAAGDHGSVTVLPGNGDGTFRGERACFAPWGARRIVTGDFDGDAAPDVAIISEYPYGALTVLFGDGHGGFRPEGVKVRRGDLDYEIAAVDVNGDGKLDLVTSCPPMVLLGDGHGAFQAPRYFGGRCFPGSGPRSLLFADFDGDGAIDLLQIGAGKMRLLPGKGDGTFLAERSVDSGGPVGVATAADLDGDGKIDLAIGTDAGLTLLFGTGAGTFEPPERVALSAPVSSIAAADLDGDGRPDLVAAHADRAESTVLLGAGGRTLRIVSRIPASGTLAVSDVDGDGVQDVVFHARGFQFALGNGDGTFQAPREAFADDGNDFALADVDRDGLPDVLLIQQQTRYLRVLRNVSR